MSEALDVTVVIPARDRAAQVGGALDSVWAQTQPPAEAVVVDDGSTDGTAEVAAAHGARVLRLGTPGGSGPARNAGIAAATTGWVALLDSDDAWLPHHLATVWPHRGHDLVAATGVDTLGALRGNHLEVPLAVTPASLLWPENPVLTSTALLRREAVLAVGGFRDLRRSQDLDLWLRLCEVRPGLSLPDVTCSYTVHAGQVTADRSGSWQSRADVLDAYADRPWCTPLLRERVATMTAWDELRAAQRSGDWATLAARARWVALRPSRVRALRGVLRWRARGRARSAGLGVAPAGGKAAQFLSLVPGSGDSP